jgi:McbB family protein
MISDTSHIFIRPFKLLATSPDRQIIYGASSVFAVENPALGSLLGDLQSSVRNALPFALFDQSCRSLGLSSEEVLEFLGGPGGILSRFDPLPGATRLCLMADDAALHSSLFESLGTWLSVPREKRTNGHLTHTILQTRYNPVAIEELYSRLGPADIAVTAYVIGHHFYIDGPYGSARGLPCHFCHREHNLATRSIQFGEAAAGWQEFMRRMVGIEGELAVPLNSAQRGAIIAQTYFSILGVIDGSATSSQRPGLATALDLETGSIERDLVPHFADCQCLGDHW